MSWQLVFGPVIYRVADMIEDEEQAKKPQELIIGADLDAVSVGELQERITLLQAEIERIRTTIGEKKHSKTAAEGFFKK